MTAYHGGKQRIAKIIATQIFNESKRLNFIPTSYIEPFVGMCSVLNKVVDLFGNTGITYQASDINRCLIAMWKLMGELKDDEVLEWYQCTRENYNELKNLNEDYYSAIKGFIGFAHSYRGVYFDSYFPHNKGKLRHSLNRVRKLGEKLKFVKWKCCYYHEYLCDRPKNAIIYLDIPYAGTRNTYYDGKNHTKLHFDHQNFYNWCKAMSKDNLLFLSEYSVPEDSGFVKIWEDTKSKEKLFVSSLIKQKQI